MSKSIGIKLADGEFYPILEEGVTATVGMDITTARDNQESVHVDLYRSENDTIGNAEFIDTLKIDVKPRPNGEPSLHLEIALDEHNVLSAKLADPESGEKTDTSVSLDMLDWVHKSSGGAKPDSNSAFTDKTNDAPAAGSAFDISDETRAESSRDFDEASVSDDFLGKSVDNFFNDAPALKSLPESADTAQSRLEDYNGTRSEDSSFSIDVDELPPLESSDSQNGDTASDNFSFDDQLPVDDILSDVQVEDYGETGAEDSPLSINADGRTADDILSDVQIEDYGGTRSGDSSFSIDVDELPPLESSDSQNDDTLADDSFSFDDDLPANDVPRDGTVGVQSDNRLEDYDGAGLEDSSLSIGVDELPADDVSRDEAFDGRSEEKMSTQNALLSDLYDKDNLAEGNREETDNKSATEDENMKKVPVKTFLVPALTFAIIFLIVTMVIKFLPSADRNAAGNATATSAIEKMPPTPLPPPDPVAETPPPPDPVTETPPDPVAETQTNPVTETPPPAPAPVRTATTTYPTTTSTPSTVSSTPAAVPAKNPATSETPAAIPVENPAASTAAAPVESPTTSTAENPASSTATVPAESPAASTAGTPATSVPQTTSVTSARIPEIDQIIYTDRPIRIVPLGSQNNSAQVPLPAQTESPSVAGIDDRIVFADKPVLIIPVSSPPPQAFQKSPPPAQTNQATSPSPSVSPPTQQRQTPQKPPPAQHVPVPQQTASVPPSAQQNPYQKDSSVPPSAQQNRNQQTASVPPSAQQNQNQRDSSVPPSAQQSRDRQTTASVAPAQQQQQNQQVASTAKPTQQSSTAAASTQRQDQPISYKVKWGDTLWDIALAYYRNPWRYTYIARYNGITNPNRIIAGTTILIPPK
jgi:hypothetical protein